MPLDAEPSGHQDALASLLRSRVVDGPLDLSVAGTSMTGTIDTGSSVTIISSTEPRRGEVWAFVDDQEQIIVHRIRHIDDLTVTGRGVGNRFDDAPVARTRLVGRVVESRSTQRSRTFGEFDRARAALTFSIRGLARRTGVKRRQ